MPYINQEVRYEKRDKETASDDYGSGSKDNQIAGMNMMVIKDGQEEAYLQCGYADKANGKMIERDTIFRLFP